MEFSWSWDLVFVQTPQTDHLSDCLTDYLSVC